MEKNKVIIIGGGVGGLAVACLLSRQGYQVELFEKNDKLGGVFNLDGPSWYMMPDVYERFFNMLGETRENYFELERVDPSYRVFFEDEKIDIYSDLEKDLATFERLEPGCGLKLRRFLDQGRKKYELAKAFMFGDYSKLLASIPFPVFSSMDRYLKKNFQSEKVRKILSYPYMFLGAAPKDIPALYSFMSYADFGLGVWLPKGGMPEIVKALLRIGVKHGVVYHANSPVEQIEVERGRAVAVRVRGEAVAGDIFISNADIHHTETELLVPKWHSYLEKYWQSRRMSFPSLLIYLELKKNLPKMPYHNIFFGRQSFYVKVEPCQSKLFILCPLVPSVDYVLDSMEQKIGFKDLRNQIVSQRFFGPQDFAGTYNYFKGSTLGLAHTLFQTAFFRPSQRSHKVRNLYYVGANTNPGIGVPSCLASAARLVKMLSPT